MPTHPDQEGEAHQRVEPMLLKQHRDEAVHRRFGPFHLFSQLRERLTAITGVAGLNIVGVAVADCPRRAAERLADTNRPVPQVS